MSKLFKYLTARQTNDRKYIPKEPINMVESSINISNRDMAIVYDVRVSLGSKVVVPQEVLERADYSLQIIRDIYRPLAEEVFGEFRKPLLDAQLAIMQGNPRDARDLIDSVLESMFDVLQQDEK